MYQGWHNLTFLHWRYPPSVLAGRLPKGVEIDTFDGSAWLRLAPFWLKLRFDRFPETNCLTYVRGPAGGGAVWFFSLDAKRLAAVAGARLAYGLPYMWSSMRMYADDRHADYASRRLWPDARAMTRISVERGEKLVLGELETFLTMRLRLYSVRRGRLITAEVEHAPWPLESARIVRLEQTITDSLGLPRPEGPALAHFSPGVDVKVKGPRLL